MELGLLRLAIALYLAGTVAALVGIAVRQDLPRTLLPRLLWAGFVAHGLSIAGRSWTAGHMAVTTFDEALSFLALLLIAVFLVVQLRRPLVALGAVVCPLAFGLTLAADAVYRGARPLAPGLDSAWLPIHVVLSVLGDAVFALAFSASLLYLVQERRLKARRAPAALRYLPSLEALDRVNYRCLVWGLVLLTLGMVSGRERVAFANGRLEPPLRRLVAVAGVAEGAILSTCNRVEVLACGPDPAALGAALPGFLASEHGVPEPALAGHLYTHTDREAVRHLFRVAASLASIVVSEPQILGQLKEQYAAAAAAGAAGQILHRCFHRSFSVAKRIRRETGIAQKAVSVASAAVQLARGIFDRLEDKMALLVGAGEMGELTARQLLAQGVGSLMVANRTYDRAIEVARELGGIPVPLDRLGRYLPLADLVIGAAGADEFVLGPPALEQA